MVVVVAMKAICVVMTAVESVIVTMADMMVTVVIVVIVVIVVVLGGCGLSGIDGYETSCGDGGDDWLRHVFQIRCNVCMRMLNSFWGCECATKGWKPIQLPALRIAQQLVIALL